MNDIKSQMNVGMKEEGKLFKRRFFPIRFSSSRFPGGVEISGVGISGVWGIFIHSAAQIFNQKNIANTYNF
jgi:hypothetical protein